MKTGLRVSCSKIWEIAEYSPHRLNFICIGCLEKPLWKQIATNYKAAEKFKSQVFLIFVSKRSIAVTKARLCVFFLSKIDFYFLSFKDTWVQNCTHYFAFLKRFFIPLSSLSSFISLSICLSLFLSPFKLLTGWYE